MITANGDLATPEKGASAQAVRQARRSTIVSICVLFAPSALMRAKIVVFAPIPSASDNTAACEARFFFILQPQALLGGSDVVMATARKRRLFRISRLALCAIGEGRCRFLAASLDGATCLRR